MSVPRIRPDDHSVVFGAADDAAGRLVRSASNMRFDQIGEPSLLPGWTRGHVLAHVARNADALVRLLEGAREGRQADMYPGSGVRERDIEAGSGRTPEEQAADLEESAERLAEAVRGMPKKAWSFKIKHRSGRVFPAAQIPWMRLAEVEYHHVDLDLAYTPAEWPQPFVAEEAEKLAARFADDKELQPVVLRDAATGEESRIGSASGQPELVAQGSASDLLAWLSGRADGSRLTVHRDGTPVEKPAATLPQLPPML